MFNFMRSPFPYPGGKARAAEMIWEGLGPVNTYIEPFAGTMAALLGCPYGARPREIVNDIDGLLVNFWRALKYAPDETAWHADYPTSHIDLTARLNFLRGQGEERIQKMLADPYWHDPELAGLWVYCISNSIVMSVERAADTDGVGRRPMVNGKAGVCIQGGDLGVGGRPVVYRDGGGQGVQRSRKSVGGAPLGVGWRPDVTPRPGGRGIQVNRSQIDDSIPVDGARLRAWFAALAGRLSRTYILCKDWHSLTSRTMTGLTQTDTVCGFFLDPPYATATRADLYAHDSRDVALDVKAWAAEHGENPRFRICVAGYIDDYADEWPAGWTMRVWGTDGKRMGGSVKAEHDRREALWFSPHCIPDAQMKMSL